MADRFKYSEVRQKIIEALKTDLIGPMCENEVLDENPQFAYLVGVLAPKKDDNESVADDQEIDTDFDYDAGDFTAGEDDDNEPITVTRFTPPSSIGISFYVETKLPSLQIEISWGDYNKKITPKESAEGKTINAVTYSRIPMKEIINVDLSDIQRTKEYSLISDSNVSVHISKITLKNGYSLVTAYVINKRRNSEDQLETLMFQVQITASSKDCESPFIAEDICREVLASDEFYFKQRPILGRGRGCAAVWGEVNDGRTEYVKSAFIPEYEFPGVSALHWMVLIISIFL